MGMAERIKKRRLVMGYTQEELALKLGLQKSAIAKYENGRVENIKRSVISKMAEVLECSPSYLMGWNNVDHLVRLRDNEELLIETYRKLPEDSKRRLEEYASALSNVHSLEEPLLNAAHARTDILTTEADRKHDEDIMDDENF